jgi:hypothetical protein
LKRRNIPGLVDLFEVSEPGEIQAFASDARIDRRFDTRGCPVNRLLLKRSLRALSLQGRRFPTMVRRDDPEHTRRQRELWSRLSERAAAIKNGPRELQSLVNWVRGVGSDGELGILVQQLLGSLFSSQLVATEESWNAATVLVAANRIATSATDQLP